MRGVRVSGTALKQGTAWKQATQRGVGKSLSRGVWGDCLPPMWTVDTIFVKNVILQLKTQHFAPQH